MEDKLLEFRKTVPQSKKLSLKLSTTSGWTTAAGLGTTSSSVKKRELNYSIADGIALADDLYASNENVSKLMIQAHSEEMAQMKTSLAAALAAAEAAQAAKPIPSRTSFDRKNQEPEPSTHPNTANNQPSSNNNPPLSNRFRSAKDQFASEVIVFACTPFILLAQKVPYCLFVLHLICRAASWKKPRHWCNPASSVRFPAPTTIATTPPRNPTRRPCHQNLKIMTVNWSRKSCPIF